jgi:hypothetical protein
MSNHELSNPNMDEHFQISKSITPDVVLDQLINELKHPINAIEGWAVILSKEDMQSLHPEAVDLIQQWTKAVKQTLAEVAIYLEEYKKANS